MLHSFKYVNIYTDLANNIVIREPCVFKLLPATIYNEYGFRAVRDKIGFVYYFLEAPLHNKKADILFSVSNCFVYKKMNCSAFCLIPEAPSWDNMEILTDGYPTTPKEHRTFECAFRSQGNILIQDGWTKEKLISGE